MNTDILFELVEQYDIITIYRHVSPDADALGSQFGLKQWIQETYPQKQVYALGKDAGSKQSLFPHMDSVSDETIAASLAIILDTANGARVDDERWSMAARTLKIDHHIVVESFADVEVVEDLFGATCEMLAFMFEQKQLQLSPVCAQYLYGGIIADTLRFSIATIKPRTLRTAAYLLEMGVDVNKANEDHFSTSYRLYRFENYIRSNVQLLDGHVAYIIVNREDYERFQLTFNEAKEKVFVLGGVDEFEAWALFTEKERDENGRRIYNGSLRSKNRTINDIANRYQGGGHRFACGVKGLYEETIQELLQELSECVNE